MEAASSGRLVPTATIVKPITNSETPRSIAASVAPQTSSLELTIKQIRRGPAPTSRKAKFQSILLDKNFEPENPKSLEELTDETCKWPIGHPNEEKFYFCGRKPEGDFPYCKLHVLYAFQPKNQKDDDLGDEIPEFIEKKVKASG